MLEQPKDKVCKLEKLNLLMKIGVNREIMRRLLEVMVSCQLVHATNQLQFYQIIMKTGQYKNIAEVTTYNSD